MKKWYLVVGLLLGGINAIEGMGFEIEKEIEVEQTNILQFERTVNGKTDYLFFEDTSKVGVGEWVTICGYAGMAVVMPDDEEVSLVTDLAELEAFFTEKQQEE